jgi:adenosine deaminase
MEHVSGMEPTLEFCRKLNKCELHAHLNGSVRVSTLQEFLLDAQRSDPNREDLKGLVVRELKSRTLDQCFDFFDIIYKVVRTPAQITRITKEVLEDFTADRVRYAEIRTTPRRDVMSAGRYLDAVLAGFSEFREEYIATHPSDDRAGDWNPPVAARLLLSIGRSFGVQDALSTVDLAVQHSVRNGGVVVGVELSGNPKVGNFETFLPALRRARNAGLPVAVHTGEVHNPTEVSAILKFRPNRLGHALIMDSAHLSVLEKAPIPIEVCPTGNMITLEIDSLKEHPVLRRCLQRGYPISLNTDDSVLFGTTLSKEYYRVARAFRLSRKEVAALAFKAWDGAFDPVVLRAHHQQNNSLGGLTCAL